MHRIQVLLFDVFGTLVDWRTSIAREAATTLTPLGIDMDWLAFADAWRDRYQPAMEAVRRGEQPYAKLDVLHRRNLDAVLAGFGIDVDETVRRHLNRAWHRLDAWPDVRAGLAALRPHFLLAPCSNGNIALMAALARRNGLPWDAILGADLVRDYKPKPAVYLAAADAFDVPPAATLMVAAHASDLAAAATAGLCTAFVERPDEYGARRGEGRPDFPVDYTAGSLTELAQALLAGA